MAPYSAQRAQNGLFRRQAGVLDLEAPTDHRTDRHLRTDSRGHVSVDVHWPGVTALPMDLVPGYPTLRQADRLFGFPAR